MSASTIPQNPGGHQGVTQGVTLGVTPGVTPGVYHRGKALVVGRGINLNHRDTMEVTPGHTKGSPRGSPRGFTTGGKLPWWVGASIS